MRSRATDDPTAAHGLAGRRVLVTGAGGFIGSHVVRRLLDIGAEVHGLVRDDRAPDRLADVLDRVRLWTADVTAFDAIRTVVAAVRPEVVFHLAADTAIRRPSDRWAQITRGIRVNLEGTLNVLRAATESDAPVARFVRTGGIEEYGSGHIPAAEGQRECPVSPYSASQVAATHYCEMLQRATRMTIVTLRPALTYGPAQSTDFFVPALIASCLAGRDFEMTAGAQRRDFVYVDDVADGVLRAAVRPGLTGAVINLGSGRAQAVREIAREIMERVGGPARLHRGTTAPRPADAADFLLDTNRAEALLGWRARTDLARGLDCTIAWYRDAARHTARSHEPAASRLGAVGAA